MAARDAEGVVMQVEIWSDVICPWCYIGKRHFEAALASFGHADDVRVQWRSFELDPQAPTRRPGTLVSHIAAKYGLSHEDAAAANDRITALAAAAGLTYRLEDAKPGNSFDAHRLIHLAASKGSADAMKERLLAAYLTEGLPIGDRDTLVALAGEVGLDRDEATRTLAGDAFVEAVRTDERAALELGIGGVPCFVVDGRWAVSGAQPPETITRVLDQAWKERRPTTSDGPAPTGEGPACSL